MDGSKIVRMNPEKDDTRVTDMKAAFANLIDKVKRDVGAIKPLDRHEVMRLEALTTTNLESACMYAVKAITSDAATDFDRLPGYDEYEGKVNSDA